MTHDAIDTMRDASQGPRVCTVQLVELSVLGLARAGAWQARLRDDAHAVAGSSADARALRLCDTSRRVLVGTMPAAARSRHPVVGVHDAEAYVNEPVLGPLPRNRSLCAAVLAGEGIDQVPRKIADVLRQVARSAHVGENAGEVTVGEGTVDEIAIGEMMAQWDREAENQAGARAGGARAARIPADGAHTDLSAGNARAGQRYVDRARADSACTERSGAGRVRANHMGAGHVRAAHAHQGARIVPGVRERNRS
ncbi:MAG: hypothetical protein PUF51_03035 [Bifidobacteriaceae bacterium]|nr:hypothetical protein [Bifidobacteriaceae bacterium]